MAAKKSLSTAIRKRLKLVPGSARQRLDPKTGVIYSRRQYEKGRVKTPRKNAPQINRKYQQYLQIRDSYIGKVRRDGKGKKKDITNRQAMQSEELKQIVRDLHSKDKQKQYRALQKTLRGDKIIEADGHLQSMKYAQDSM